MGIEDALRLAVLKCLSAWFESYGTIQQKGGTFLRAPELRANWLQQRISDVFEYCILMALPIRLLILKPRQKGCSTFSVAALYVFLQSAIKRGAIIGSNHEQGANLLRILDTYAKNDESVDEKVEVITGKARFPNGSTVAQLTASNPEAGRSATLEALLSTEVPRWSEEGVANAPDVLAGLLKCVPHLPGTMVILEGTAYGAAGDFYDRWQNGITFDDLKDGKDGWVKVFAPWFVFADSVRSPQLENLESAEDYSLEEMKLAVKYNLSLSQVAWMRWAIREECKGDFDTFCQDYPFDDVTAFLTSGRKVFSAHALKTMKEEAALPKNQPDFGTFTINQDEIVSWSACAPADSKWLRWEKPIDGCCYIMMNDVMTGASQTGGKDPDNHAPIIWRKGYYKQGKGWIPPRVVARAVGDWPEWVRNKRYVLIWDIDILEEEVWRASLYYGSCMIAVELNMDRGLIRGLQIRGANLYEREIFNRREYTIDKALGFMTDTRTREMVVEELKKGIREHGRSEDGIDIHCPIILDELENFVIKANGRSEAMSGKHDDNVISAGVGLLLIGEATTYRVPINSRKLPPDLQALEEQSESQNGENSSYT